MLNKTSATAASAGPRQIYGGGRSSKRRQRKRSLDDNSSLEVAKDNGVRDVGATEATEAVIKTELVHLFSPRSTLSRYTNHLGGLQHGERWPVHTQRTLYRAIRNRIRCSLTLLTGRDNGAGQWSAGPAGYVYRLYGSVRYLI